jgi:hypothetical protein
MDGRRSEDIELSALVTPDPNFILFAGMNVASVTLGLSLGCMESDSDT